MYILKAYKVLTYIHTQKTTAKFKIMNTYISITPQVSSASLGSLPHSPAPPRPWEPLIWLVCFFENRICVASFTWHIYLRLIHVIVWFNHSLLFIAEQYSVAGNICIISIWGLSQIELPNSDILSFTRVPICTPPFLYSISWRLPTFRASHPSMWCPREPRVCHVWHTWGRDPFPWK